MIRSVDDDLGSSVFSSTPGVAAVWFSIGFSGPIGFSGSAGSSSLSQARTSALYDFFLDALAQPAHFVRPCSASAALNRTAICGMAVRALNRPVTCAARHDRWRRDGRISPRSTICAYLDVPIGRSNRSAMVSINVTRSLASAGKAESSACRTRGRSSTFRLNGLGVPP